MPKSDATAIQWLDTVEEHDYLAAESYLRIIYPDDKARAMVLKLRAAAITPFKAKDIFRASQLTLLGVLNSHVQKDSKKIREGTRLSPVLLVRDEVHGKVVIADGYHRLCAIYDVDEDSLIHCKII
jgi:disulfide oxidoreductase YuzD